MSIQTELKCAKNQVNKFGGYNYRSCEDILESVKPLLAKYNAVIVISDDVVQLGERYYIKATVQFRDCETDQTVTVSAFAREPSEKKGSDASQITGASSSYARKYALSGLFALDDTKDSDFTNTGDKGGKSNSPAHDAPPKPAAPNPVQPIVGNGQTVYAQVEYKCADCGKPITAVTLKSGQVLSAAEVYAQLQDLNTDGVCRCKECRAKAGTEKPKG